MSEPTTVTSRIPGFYRQPVDQRRARLLELGRLSPESRALLEAGGGLEQAVADLMSENVVGVHGLPLAVALNFRVDHRDVLVPMAVEEPSVVAAASNAARIVRMTGGFFGEAMPAEMTTQVQLDGVPDAGTAPGRIEAIRDTLFTAANRAMPGMIARGGGCRDMDVRVLDVDEGVVVVHLYVDVGDAMGANLVDTVAEAVAPLIQQHVGGEVGLRILSNLPIRRRVRVRCDVSASPLGGDTLCDRIARASRFAELDPYRAVTHNKGIMNGVDAVALALGQDWRSIEAGAHSFASLSGTYKPLAIWKRTEGGLRGEVDMPMAVGTVGGCTRVHPGVRLGLELADVKSAGELGILMAAAGLASNLAALKALAGEGIQKGHMRLHHRKEEIAGAEARSLGAERGAP